MMPSPARALAFVIAVFVDWESTAWLTFHGGIFLVAPRAPP